MDTLKRILAVMVVILIIVTGAGIYLGTRHTDHGLNLWQQPKQKQAGETKEAPKEKVTVVLEPDLRNYIDEINKGISLINEANGLITADPFFADPPKVPKGKLETTPLDKQIPKERDNPILLMPDGTYQVIGDSGLDMQNIHRGIYKLGQGMAVLDSVLAKMNEDIKNSSFPLRQSVPGWNTYPYYVPGYSTNPSLYGGQIIPGTSVQPGMITPNGNLWPNNQTMPHGTAGAHGTDLGTSFNWLTVSNVLYFILIVFLMLAIIAVIGFVLSLFRERPANSE